MESSKLNKEINGVAGRERERNRERETETERERERERGIKTESLGFIHTRIHVVKRRHIVNYFF